tara:strand:+ start:352 stop:711 length:360 start_codon:yes stop_codon:yes gene_type:complete
VVSSPKKNGERVASRQLSFFTIEGWGGFTTWASHVDQGNVLVRRQMIHPDGTVHHKEIIGSPFKVCVEMKGVCNGGTRVVMTLLYPLPFFIFFSFSPRTNQKTVISEFFGFQQNKKSSG